ncbi:MAG: hypothetical protein ACI4O7_10410 [Aristaeellaceae bacterium]
MTPDRERYDATYVFSADRQEEVRKIYQKYAPAQKKPRSGEDEKLEQLRQLDRSVARRGAAATLVTLLCGTVCHGAGIAMVQCGSWFVPGTAVAFLGLVLFLAAWPVYCLAAGRQRRRVEAQILQLCRELMK